MTDTEGLTAQILESLTQYTTEISLQVNKAARTCARKLKDDIVESSPRLTGSYAEGWKIKQQKNNGVESGYIVYNAEKGWLTHLLEFGHAIKGGTERVKAIPHIKPAEDRAVANFERMVDKIIEEAGK